MMYGKFLSQECTAQGQSALLCAGITMNRDPKPSVPGFVISQSHQGRPIPKETQHFYDFGPFRLDADERVLFRDAEPVALAPKVFDTLLLLVRNKGKIIEKEELMKALWPDSFVEESNIPQNIFTLRKALGERDDGERFIETIPRRGYRFIAPVSIPLSQQGNSNNSQSAISPLGNVAGSVGNAVTAAHSRVIVGNTRWSRYAWPAVSAVLLVGAIFGYLRHRAGEFRFTPKGTIVLADFLNSTGAPVFDDALKQGLNVGLEQSPMVQILSDEKSAQILKQMGHSADQTITGRTAIELCQRAGGKVTIQGTISNIGTAYFVGLTAIRCDNGEAIAHEQIEATRKEDVIDALGKVTAQLRGRLGESLPSLQKYDTPLQQATTPSLEALRAYGQAYLTRGRLGDSAAIPFFERAIELDPNFALPYGELATIHENRGEVDLGRLNATKAYALREQVTEFERLSIESWYYVYVTGDLDKAVAALETKLRIYPDTAASTNDLGTVYGNLGLFEKEIDLDRNALRLDPLEGTTYGNLAVSLMALGRVEEAGTVLADAGSKGLQSDFLLQVNYWRAFLREDTEEMRHILSLSAAVSGAESLLLSEQANTEAFYGHFDRSRQLSLKAAAIMQGERQPEGAGLCLAQAAVREVEIGDWVRARKFIVRALNLTHNKNVVTLAALVMARIGDSAKARSLVEKLDKEHPADSFVQKYWLPIIRAELELQRGNGTNAVNDLSNVERLDGAAPPEFSISTLYPAYVRGQAYLSAGDGLRAGGEFQKLLDHPGMVLNFQLGALARLGLARAFRLAGNKEAARNAYDAFLALWKEGDPDLPILRQAQTEAAQIRK
jgi:DNA-binding winged helix-turn-helix (wHTH) protein/tetratricopeptide (TPR) repeat protein